MNTGETKVLNSNNINCYVWQDKKKVLLLSTVYGGQMKEFDRYNPDNPSLPLKLKRPGAIHYYNQYCHSVDKSNQNSQYYNYERKSRWYKKVFFQMLEVSICNAYILYKLTCQKHDFRPLTSFDFRMQLIESLLEKYMADSEDFENISRELNQERKAELHRMRRTTERHFLTEIIAPMTNLIRMFVRIVTIDQTEPKKIRDSAHDISVSNVELHYAQGNVSRRIILHLQMNRYFIVIYYIFILRHTGM